MAKLLGLAASPAARPSRPRRAAGDARRFALPRPLLDRDGCDLSFSGLKTAVRRARDRLVAAQGGLTRADRADLCAGFQAAVAETLAEKTRRALARLPRRHPARAGARRRRRRRRQRARSAPRLAAAAAEATAPRFLAPPLALCTDNGAMIAWAAAERMAVARARRPRRSPPARAGRSTRAAAPMLGAGRKGAKA